MFKLYCEDAEKEFMPDILDQLRLTLNQWRKFFISCSLSKSEYSGLIFLLIAVEFNLLNS